YVRVLRGKGMPHRERLRDVRHPQTDMETRRGKVQLLLGKRRPATCKRAGPPSQEEVVGQQPEHTAPCQPWSGPRSLLSYTAWPTADFTCLVIPPPGSSSAHYPANDTDGRTHTSGPPSRRR